MKENTEFIKDVLEFHRTFNHPVLETPQIPSEERQDLRVLLIEEELKELDEALITGDIVETADALADIMYVLSGAILECGLGDKFAKIFAEVHRSNMSKACETEEEALQTMAYYAEQGQGAYHKFNEKTSKWNVFRESDNKLLKSINYSPANLKDIIEND